MTDPLAGSGYLVIYTYKGHQTQHVVKGLDAETRVSEFVKRISGLVDAVYAPYEWIYDPETETPVPL